MATTLSFPTAFSPPCCQERKGKEGNDRRRGVGLDYTCGPKHQTSLSKEIKGGNQKKRREQRRNVSRRGVYVQDKERDQEYSKAEPAAAALEKGSKSGDHDGGGGDGSELDAAGSTTRDGGGSTGRRLCRGHATGTRAGGRVGDGP